MGRLSRRPPDWPVCGPHSFFLRMGPCLLYLLAVDRPIHGVEQAGPLLYFRFFRWVLIHAAATRPSAVMPATVIVGAWFMRCSGEYQA